MIGSIPLRAARSLPPPARLAGGGPPAPPATRAAVAEVTVAPPEPASPWDQPVASAWPAERAWSDALERDYGRFVARVGRAVAEGRCRRLDECLRDPAANALYAPGVDDDLPLQADCADLPYLLRA